MHKMYPISNNNLEMLSNDNVKRFDCV